MLMKIIDLIYKLAAIIYTCLFTFVLVRWQIFDRPIAKQLGFLGDLLIIFSIMALIVGTFFFVQFNHKLKKFPIIKLFLKILVVIFSLFGSYYIIAATYIDIDPTVMQYWRSGEWKW
jgi:hypothetical protein